MENLSRCLLIFVFILFDIVVLGNTTPVWNPQTSPGLGRNIRHLPCVSRRTGESGVCMFAISCAKANGTHLGTCIDRFYFGSCCKLALDDSLAEPLDNNHIFEESPSHAAAVVTSSTSTSPLPSPAASTAYTAAYSASVTASPAASTENYHISTFQSVHTVTNITQTTPSPSTSTSTPRTTVSTTYKPTKKPTSKPSTTSPSSTFTHKPVSTGKPPVSKPQSQSTTTKPRPPSKPSQRPPGTKPTTKPSSKPPVKVPVKPSKPSNTTSKPPQKPSNTTNKPSKPSPTKRPTGSSTSKPLVKPSSKPQSKPTTPRPQSQTKPPLKPVPVVTASPATDPNYVQLPVVTVSTPKPPQATTISNDVVQKPVGNSSVEAEEESSNVIQETVVHTTSSTLLVTWTTVDEKPLPPLPKPSSTASGPVSILPTNDTKVTTTTDGTTPSSQTWVEVSMSTPGPTTTEHPQPAPSAPVTQPTSSPTTPAGPTAESAETTTTSASPKPAEPAEPAAANASTLVASNTDDIIQNEIASLNLNMSNYQDVCGRRLFPQSRIVGGDKSTFGKWPWQISLRQWRTSTYLHKCGAALLNENWAITAAHCVENVAPSDLLLRLGEHDLSLEDEPYGYQERRVQIVASHPQFDPRTFEYDLALLRFYEPVTFQPNIIPVCVPQDDTNFVGSTAYVTGWGRLYEDGPLPSVLQEVSVPVINNTVCETMYRAAGYIEHIPEIFICAGWKKGGFDSCEGDSGGPMVIQRPDRRWLLAGVISWGIGCAEPNQPGVYTRISEFRGWINQILQF